ncbi:hypothetical protein STAS_09712 [Striga asiatica]|uniref:Uncharacterized protein n=1 Tax=Striga asiatica TaxID=4170 RepID=A0A5A7PLN5_STRAF|nr:hypothetical protein STAS_09712 [Striga asiatica]
MEFRQRGHVMRQHLSHFSRHGLWKTWPHDKRLTSADRSNSDRQIEHSCPSGPHGKTESYLTDSEGLMRHSDGSRDSTESSSHEDMWMPIVVRIEQTSSFTAEIDIAMFAMIRQSMPASAGVG